MATLWAEPVADTTRAWRDDGSEVPLGGSARRALLALLSVRAGEVVASERLIDDLYGGQARDGAARALQPQVSRPGDAPPCRGLPEGRAGSGQVDGPREQDHGLVRQPELPPAALPPLEGPHGPEHQEDGECHHPETVRSGEPALASSAATRPP
ncbi:hypothetical protein [Nonomuraea rosea]|uniref:hypothetical protein n=1 Tax=Nonomuraea rosea TaxID=638574 RepID=UPI0031EFACAC